MGQVDGEIKLLDWRMNTSALRFIAPSPLRALDWSKIEFSNIGAAGGNEW